MGTRSLTIVRDENGTDILTLYRQYDGYPEGHGKELTTFLRPFDVTQGIRSYEAPYQANGAGCLAAQIVAHFKRRTPKTKRSPAQGPQGNFYIYPNGVKDVGEEYVYIVTARLGSPDVMVCDETWKPIVQGSPANVRAWIVKQQRKQVARKAAQTRKEKR